MPVTACANGEAGAVAGKRGRKRALKKARARKKDVIQWKREEYSLKKQENKILSEEQLIFFPQVEARHFGFFFKKLKLKNSLRHRRNSKLHYPVATSKPQFQNTFSAIATLLPISVTYPN